MLSYITIKLFQISKLNVIMMNFVLHVQYKDNVCNANNVNLFIF